MSSKEKKGDAPLDPDQAYRAAMGELIGRRWAAVWKAVPVALAGEDIEGVHDVRVASRRLRAAMDVAAECFPARWYAPLHRTAKEITGALGEVRDRDVMIDHLIRDRDAAPDAERPGIDLLIGHIERERVTAREAMETYLAELLAAGVAEETSRRFARPRHERDGAPGPNGAETPNLTELER
jgi:CHAD domain-containing protein